MISRDNVRFRQFLPGAVTLFMLTIRPKTPQVDEEIVEPSEGFEPGMCDAVSVIINRIVRVYVGRDMDSMDRNKPFAIEARDLLAKGGDPVAYVGMMIAVPRQRRGVPDNLLGLLELMLRAAESGARLGPVMFGLGNLLPKTWQHLKIAAQRGMTSHELLTIWAARQIGRSADAKLVDAFVALPLRTPESFDEKPK